MAKKKKLTAEQTAALDAACQAAFGIDWAALIAKLEALLAGAAASPLVQAIIQALLASLLKKQPMAAAKGENCVCCHEVLCSSLEHAGLCAEMCCQCEVYG